MFSILEKIADNSILSLIINNSIEFCNLLTIKMNILEYAFAVFYIRIKKVKLYEKYIIT